MRSSLVGSRSIDQSSTWAAETMRLADGWLARAFAVLGLDYSAVAIENCRRLSTGHPNAPIFKVIDLCGENLPLEPAFSLIDRSCFHRIVANFRPVFVRNIAKATVEGGHFLLLAGTIQDARVANYGTARSERHLRERVGEIFGNHFIVERAEPALINASEGHEARSAAAFWILRKPTSPFSDVATAAQGPAAHALVR